MYIVCIIVTISVIWLLEMFLVRYSKINYLKDIPGPKSYPLIGCLLSILALDSTAVFYIPRKWSKQFPSIYCTRILDKAIVHLLRPEDIEALLSSTRNIRKSHVYYFLTPWLRKGLLTSDGPQWHRRRKILTSAFHFNILQQFVPILEDHSSQLVRKLKPENNKSETNITPFITGSTLNSISETAMGTVLESSDESASSYKVSVYRIGELIVYRLLRPWLHHELLFDMTPTGREQKQVLSHLHSFTNNIIKERRSNLTPERPEKEKKDETVLFGKRKMRLALLDLLLSTEAKGDIDEHGIMEEVDTFMFEGHDTTAMGTVFSLLCLANNPDIQEKIYKELTEILGESNRASTIQELNQMKYLERCIKEALRLYPSVPFISRELDEPLILSNSKYEKYTIPAGVEAYIHVFDLHRDPRLYPDPEVYDPDRFLPENCEGRHPYAYIPFSAGPRNCIGQKYALLELKSLISTILRNYKLEAITKPEDVIFVGDLVLRPKHPIRMKLRPRNIL